jgi:hypothetical protein
MLLGYLYQILHRLQTVYKPVIQLDLQYDIVIYSKFFTNNSSQNMGWVMTKMILVLGS